MEGNLGKEILRKKKDKNEKFYFGKVEALAKHCAKPLCVLYVIYEFLL